MLISHRRLMPRRVSRGIPPGCSARRRAADVGTFHVTTPRRASIYRANFHFFHECRKRARNYARGVFTAQLNYRRASLGLRGSEKSRRCASIRHYGRRLADYFAVSTENTARAAPSLRAVMPHYSCRRLPIIRQMVTAQTYH